MPQNFTGSAVLVLAAGGGTRLGGGKLLLPWKGRPLLVHTLQKALNLPQMLSVTVVLGHQAIKVQDCLEANLVNYFLIRVVHNPDWEKGLSSSLQCGLGSLLNSSEATRLGSILVMLGDQPLVREQTLVQLCQSHNAACAVNPKHAATIPVYQGKRGNPVVLSCLIFPCLFKLSGDIGARALLDAYKKDVLFLPVDDQGVILDVDSPEDYAALPEN